MPVTLIKGGSEIAILKHYQHHTWARVNAALCYVRDRAHMYTPAERDTLREILIEVKNYYVASYSAGIIEDNPGPVASRLYFYMRSLDDE